MKIILIFIILVTAFTVNANEEYRPEIYINTGFSLPLSPDNFTDYWKLDINFGAGVGFPINNFISIQSYISYNNFGINKNKIKRDIGSLYISIDGGNISALTISSNLHINLNNMSEVYNERDCNKRQAEPYFIFGFGYLILNMDDITISGTGGSEVVDVDSESAFTFGFGLGSKFRIATRTKLFFETMYHLGLTDKENISYMSLKIGIMIN